MICFYWLPADVHITHHVTSRSFESRRAHPSALTKTGGSGMVLGYSSIVPNVRRQRHPPASSSMLVRSSPGDAYFLFKSCHQNSIPNFKVSILSCPNEVVTDSYSLSRRLRGTVLRQPGGHSGFSNLKRPSVNT